jgi:nucleotide-binding universal stress UspA family protein
VRTDVLAGVGFVEVIRLSQRKDHDIVFCSPTENSGRSLAGSSLAMHLLRKSPVPVWVGTPRGDPSPDVAVAVGPFDPEVRNLNERLIQLAGSLAAIRGGTLHFIHAWRFEGESLLRRGRVRQPAAHVDRLVETAFLEASANMKHLSGRVEAYGLPYEVHLEKGRPDRVIPLAIGLIRPGVVVLGTLAQTGLAGMFIGNTAEQVLGVVEASVLAAKPDDLVSPIAPY